MLAQLVNLQILFAALKLWKQKRLQAILSSLGIVVGVSGLVLVISLGQGANRELESAMGTLGAGSLVVKQPPGKQERPSLSVVRVNAARRLLAVSIDRMSVLTIKQLNTSSSDARLDAAKVIGTDRYYQQIFKLGLHSGRFLSDLDLSQKKRVCVLGWEAGQALFPRGQVLNQEIRIGNDWYQVVGWLRPSTYKLPKLEALGWSEADRIIYTPVTTLAGKNDGYFLDELILQFHNESTMTAALETVKRIISFGREESSLEYIVPIELLRQKQKLQQIFQYLLLGIAALMLIVGGVGIMNMMMLNVISRRAEIGLRRAIGATRHDIIAQFVTESSVIALVGGISGVVLGYVVSALIDQVTSWPMEFNGIAAAIGFASSVVIGVIFGSYPALQAASVSPVQALNEL